MLKMFLDFFHSTSLEMMETDEPKVIGFRLGRSSRVLPRKVIVNDDFLMVDDG